MPSGLCLSHRFTERLQRKRQISQVLSFERNLQPTLLCLPGSRPPAFSTILELPTMQTRSHQASCWFRMVHRLRMDGLYWPGPTAQVASPRIVPPLS